MEIVTTETIQGKKIKKMLGMVRGNTISTETTFLNFTISESPKKKKKAEPVVDLTESEDISGEE